ncbi:type II toxin-antitoxin system RelE/ParE family toxin [Candidatus Peregrinibacteria bacterium]|nr:type II toxin-antitoxin system RelE/ParE family toxin [Candidatus Peregrinibacteria bacterium]MBT4055850.1 type II toxin-antitoxin system RelE/ParE family toxin [Candidatus Peregrinibacteria bacterium]
MPHSKKIDDKLFELRIRGKKEVRIIYCFYRNTIILLHAFVKKTQKIPKRSILVAKNRLNSLDRL